MLITFDHHHRLTSVVHACTGLTGSSYYLSDFILSTSRDRVPSPVPSQDVSSHSSHTPQVFILLPFRLSPSTVLPNICRQIPSHSHSYSPDVRTILVFHVSPHLTPLPRSNDCTSPYLIFCSSESHRTSIEPSFSLPSPIFAYLLSSSAMFHCHTPKPFAHMLCKPFLFHQRGPS